MITAAAARAEPILDDAEEPRFDPSNEVRVAGLGNVVIFVLKQILRRGGQIRKITKLPKRLPRVGRPNSKWKFGKHKSEKKWKNQMEQRGWTEEEITDTIKYGKEYKAPNRVRNNEPGATATRYEKDGKFVVRDDQTGEILQISGDKFEPLKF